MKSRSKNQVSQAEKVLLLALAKGGGYSEYFTRARANLPPEFTLADLFESAPARDFVTSLFREPGVFERFRSTPEVFLMGDLAGEIKAILTEAWVSSDSDLEEADLKFALDRGTAKAWARFSQQVEAALAQAEAKKDAGLQEKLLKDYLDVQRKMKEFSSFYDEA
jgi:hypothetical protein